MKPPALPPRSAWLPLLERALAEDLATGDVTSNAIFGPDDCGEAAIVARRPLVACGLAVAEAVFAALDPRVAVERSWNEGEAREGGGALLRVRGPMRAILAGERTALNFLSRLCGVATHTRRYVQAVAGTGCHIVDTRKTLPGWRVLDKYATAVGGAESHRMGLYDAILVKDNHIAAAGGVARAVRAVRANAPPHLRLQVEVESAAQAEEALAAGAEWLLLDNRSVDELRDLAKRFRERALLEASGGVTLETVRAVAETGVHRVSIGALTQAAPGADVALDFVRSAV
ncbi:MAG: carboxylating nicotinate-nucleotide diphosphorylase [Proteobacteria bacterium]|nr:MAG: carboxylating nicotinate-nucleotide diphosphorylase [Pseudomonadota bacterium]